LLLSQDLKKVQPWNQAAARCVWKKEQETDAGGWQVDAWRAGTIQVHSAASSFRPHSSFVRQKVAALSSLREASVAPSRKSKRFWIWLAAAVVVVVALLGIGAARLTRGSGIDLNKLAKVTRADVARSVVATGKIQPITKVEVKSKASGIVEKLYVDINNQVHKGQQLAQLDQQEIVAQVEAQRAQLAAAEANVSTYQANIEQDKVNAAAPDLPMYKATLDRNLEMQKLGIVSRQALDDANKDYLAALTRRDSAKAQIGVDAARLKQARAQVLQAQASLKQLEEQLSYTTIVAPMDGVILSRDVEIGDAVSSILVLGSTATLVMTEGDINQVYVQGKVDEADIAHVYMSQPARIKVESFRDRVFNGKVTKIAPLGVEKDNVTTFEVRVSIDNPGGELKANMTANAEIILDEHKGVLTVPESAVIYDSQKKATVEVPDKKQKEGKRKVPVTVGLSNGSVTEILSGLKEGDSVVLQQ
jgi:HlyD family secretion protein